MTENNQPNVMFQMAYDFVNETNCNVFLTGNAGTGKTTFLQHVKKHCTKNLIVVAPTGVAAINAGGVTLHSFFQLPFGTYVANAPYEVRLNQNIVDRNTLLSKIRISGKKRDIIESLELIIIDEVSMLRSDMLDALDTILQFVRRNTKPFGGIQMLFIGDLFQLPPVVKDSEKFLLDQYYQSPFFFHSNAIANTQMLNLELKKIYRQSDSSFIELLNHVRNNELDQQDFETLRKRFNPNFESNDEKYITLCSHNYKADAINEQSLRKLNSPLHTLEGKIKNDYNANSLPAPMQFQCKVGAQVMFIKNDSSGERKYYNGKLAIVTKIEDETISVQFPEGGDILEIEKETWDNISYTIDDDSKQISEKVIGQYTQFPLRLAWAITIHKSQGLTFERAIIDAGDSFAPGQVYVALSRCTTLEGIVLKTMITSQSLHTDARIFSYQTNEMSEQALKDKLQLERENYDALQIRKSFDWKQMLHSISDLEHVLTNEIQNKKNETAALFIKNLYVEIGKQHEFVQKFLALSEKLLVEKVNTGNSDQLILRTTNAIHHFTKNIQNDFLKPLRDHIKTYDQKTQVKKVMKVFGEVEKTWWEKLRSIEQIKLNGNFLILQQDQIKKEVEPKIKTTKQKGDSAKESFVYFSAGKSIAEISELRKLAISTVTAHLSEFVRSGELDVHEFLNDQQIASIKKGYETAKFHSTTEIKEILKNEFSHEQIRLGISHLFLMKEIEPKSSEPRSNLK